MHYRNYEPQLTVEGEFKQTAKSDLIVFEIPLGPIRIVCIVTVPEEGKNRAPVYCKFRVGRSRPNPRVEHRNGRNSPVKVSDEESFDEVLVEA